MRSRSHSVLAFCLVLLLLAPLADCQQADPTSSDLGKKHHQSQHKGGPKQHKGGTKEELECADLAKLSPGADRCAFALEHCEEHGSLLNYPRLYYCGVAPHGALLGWIMVVLCVCLLLLLFRVIARASDDFFSCILSQISQDLGLPPRLGGVTLLALGNGAPDLSASIEAVKSGDYQLAMGALTGAGMFVGAVVAGRIVSLNGGVRARGAQLRDISTQFLTVAVVTGIVASGSFTYASVATLLSISGGYVVVVAVADFSKRAGVEWGEVARKVSRRWSQRFRVEMSSPLLREDYGADMAVADVAAVGSLTRSPSPPGAPSFLHHNGHLAVGGTGRLLPMPEEGAEQLSGSSSNQGEEVDRGGVSKGRPPLALPAAGSLPPDLEAAVGAAAAQAQAGSSGGGGGRGDATSSWPAPGGAMGGRGSSLPDFHTEARRHEQQGQQGQQGQQQGRPPQQYLHRLRDQHLRQGPPVAHFQPHMSYGDIVQMSAREYRQRALAEMAQSKSFFERGDGRVQEEERSDSDSEVEGAEYFSGQEEGSEGAAEQWEESAAAEQRQQQLRRQGAGRQQAGREQHWGEYQPPVVALNSTLLAAQQAVAEFEAEQAAAAVAAGRAAEEAETGLVAGGSRLSLPPPHGGAAAAGAAGLLPAQQHPQQQRRVVAFQHQSSGSRASGASGASTLQFSVASLEVAPPAAGAGMSNSASGVALRAEVEASEQQGPLGALMRAADTAQRPLLVLLQATIPLVEANSYHRTWFLYSLAASPLFIIAYLGLFSWQALLCALCAGVVLAAAGHVGTRQLQGKAPLWTFGTSYPLGAAVVAVYGFCVAAMWISVFASEIVGLLQFFGMLSKVEPAVLGVTVLAWGNSLIDYLNNTAMAGRSRGGNSMAMTACFAGPLFNMLVGLGLGFWALLQETHATRTAVAMDPVVLVGCVFIMLNCTCLVGVSLTHRQWLPAWCGYAMVACYCAYLASVTAVLLLVGNDDNAARGR